MAAAASRVYTVTLNAVSVTAAISLIQVVSGATVPLQIIRCNIGQSSSTTSTQQRVQVNRKSGAATVTSFTPLKKGPVTDPAASAVPGTSSTGTNASAEGTDTNVIWADVFNYLNGWLYLPTPKEYDFCDAASTIALKLPAAPGSSVTLVANVIFEELG